MRDFPWVEAELAFPGGLRRGDTGMAVRRVQEHCTLRGHATTIDGIYGPATEAVVAAFQAERPDLAPIGVVTPATWARLTAPLRSALPDQTLSERSFGESVVWLAERHLEAGPREVGGPNAGPWVRLYMKGNDGKAFLWCAGFASFVVLQAASLMHRSPLFPYTWSCDQLAMFGESETALIRGDGGRPDLPAPALFVIRDPEPETDAPDWFHAGIVTRFGEEVYETVEGNTAQDGGREGTAVYNRMRAYSRHTDFVALTG